MCLIGIQYAKKKDRQQRMKEKQTKIKTTKTTFWLMHAQAPAFHRYGPWSPSSGFSISLVQSTYLNIIQSVAQVVHAHVIANNRRVQAVRVRREQLRPPKRFPPHPGRTPLQAQDLTRQSAPPVGAEALLALPDGPRLLLVRWRRLVYGVKRVAEVGVRVTGLRIGDGLVGRREVRGLEVGTGRVRQGGRRAVEVLTDRWQVRQPVVPVAVSIGPFLEDGETRQLWEMSTRCWCCSGELSVSQDKMWNGNVRLRFFFLFW